jgi:hypothetical protein
MTQAERIADRDHEIADLHLIRIADRQIDQIVGFNLDDGYVGRGIRAHDFRIQGIIVEQRDLNLVGADDDMMIGQDVTIFSVHDDTGTGARDFTRPAFEVRQPEKSPEHFVTVW